MSLMVDGSILCVYRTLRYSVAFVDVVDVGSVKGIHHLHDFYLNVENELNM